MKRLLLFLLLAAASLAQTNNARMVSGTNLQTGSTYSFVAADATRVVVFSNASPVAATLPSGLTSNFGAGNVFAIQNIGAGAVTITCSGCLIYSTNSAGSATLVLASGQGVDLWGSSGANYYAVLGGGSASAPFSSITSATNTSAQMVVGSGADLHWLGSGAITGNQQVMGNGLAFIPTLNSANTGGALSNNSVTYVRIAFNNASGVTAAPVEGGKNVGASCTGGNQCSVIVTAPTLPTGFTGYTVYDSSAINSEKLEVTCANITTNCTITNYAVGAAYPTSNTAWFTPTPLAASSTCAPQTQPTQWVYDGTSYYPYAGIDTSNTSGALGSLVNARLAYCLPVWFNDSIVNDPVGYKNGFVVINHVQNNTVNNQAGQDRGMAILASNCFPASSCADSGTHYALEALQVEQDIAGTPTINGSPDGEVTAGSFQTSIQATAIYGSSFGTNAIRAGLTRSAAGRDSNGNNGVQAYFYNNTASAGSGELASGILASCQNLTTTISGLNCAALRVSSGGLSAAGHFSNGWSALAIGNNASYTPNTSGAYGTRDWAIKQDYFGLPSQLGDTYIGALQTSSPIALQIKGTTTVVGAVQTQQQTDNPSANLNTSSCTGGASQYSYAVVGVDANGGTFTTGAANTPSTCVNPLTGGNPVTFNTNSTGYVPYLGLYDHLDIYRSAGPMGTGKIGCLGKAGSGCTWTCTNQVLTLFPTCGPIVDTGIVADGTTFPAANTTGSISAPLYKTNTNCAAVGTAASPSVASCVAAPAGQFSCATNATGATCTVNTTAVTAKSEIFVFESDTPTTGTALGVTCNTGTNVLPASRLLASSAAGTSFTINLGTVTTNPACFSYNIVN